MKEDKHKRTFNELCDEAHDNAKTDRTRMNDLIKQMNKATEKNPEIAPLLGDMIVKMSDCMTKSNAQIIQIAQLKMKDEVKVRSEEELDEDDVDSLYDHIGSSLEDKAKDDKN